MAAYLANKARSKGSRNFLGLHTSSMENLSFDAKGGSVTLYSTVAGIVLQSPMTSVLGIINQQVPVSDMFENIKKLAKIKTPFLVFHGTDDSVIPISHSRVKNKNLVSL